MMKVEIVYEWVVIGEVDAELQEQVRAKLCERINEYLGWSA